MADKQHETQAMPDEQDKEHPKHLDWKLGGRGDGGDSNGGPYPNPYSGKEDEGVGEGFGEHGGQSVIGYHGPEQLGSEVVEPGGNPNAGTRKN